MSRLLPCPSCGRHVRVAERECPFCSRVLAIAAAPSRLTVVLLGLCFAACSTGTEAPAGAGERNEQPADAKSTAQPEPEPQPEPELQPQPQPNPVEPQPEAEAVGETTSAVLEEAGSAGTTDGSSATADPVEPKPPPKPMYGLSRPKKKYGAPPKPPKEDPFD